MNIENQKFEEWRNEQIASLIRAGYPDAAKAFRDLGSVQWAGWQAAWIASRAAIEIELPKIVDKEWANTHAERCAMRDAIGLCKKRIEAAGLKVKA